MLRDKSLVAFYDIRPGNTAGLFFQPRSPHWAGTHKARLPYAVRARQSSICGEITSLVTYRKRTIGLSAAGADAVVEILWRELPALI